MYSLVNPWIRFYIVYTFLNVGFAYYMNFVTSYNNEPIGTMVLMVVIGYVLSFLGLFQFYLLLYRNGLIKKAGLTFDEVETYINHGGVYGPILEGDKASIILKNMGTFQKQADSARPQPKSKEFVDYINKYPKFYQMSKRYK